MRFYMKIFCLSLSLMFSSLAFGQASIDVSPPLSIEVTQPMIGSTIDVEIMLTNDESENIDAFGFKFVYPEDILSFEGVDDSGTLTDGWTFVDGQAKGSDPDTVTVGGFDTESSISGSGILVKIQFEVLSASGTGLIRLFEFVNNISGATTTDGTVNTSVPVELAAFSAQVQAGQVYLKWLTLTETNNYGFDVEKSVDGTNFSKVAFVKGHGTTTKEEHYEYVDSDATAGSRYYRLKQIDFDGAFDYSSTLKVEINAPREFALAQNYPNPFNPSTAIQFSMPTSGKVKITVYDMLGRAVRELVNGEYAPGTHSVTWHGRNDAGALVASGLYFYKIQTNGFSQTRRMIFMQ